MHLSIFTLTFTVTLVSKSFVVFVSPVRGEEDFEREHKRDYRDLVNRNRRDGTVFLAPPPADVLVVDGSDSDSDSARVDAPTDAPTDSPRGCRGKKYMIR